MNIAIIAITGNGARLGCQLRDALPDAVLHLPPKWADACMGPFTPFPGCLRELVVQLWRKADGLVFIMATGIVVRLIAPLLEGKDRDPAVVVMDDSAKFAVSLLSGHLGGANDLAGRCAAITGAMPVITTATDANGLPSFDMLAKEQGWAIDDLSRVKTLNALLLEKGRIAVVDPTGQVEQHFCGRGNLTFHPDFTTALRSGASGFLFVTDRSLPPQLQHPALLVLRPQNLVLGMGCNSGTSVEEIEEVVLCNLKRQFLSIRSVNCVATAAVKRDEPGLVEFAQKYSLPVVCFESNELNTVPSPSPPSRHAMEAIGATGVAEPAALLASGGGRLLLKKVKSGNVTLAIAEIQ
ncbi:MAG: cobalt-precorrin 5A hydrolase [Geobacteraceae bacterium]|nr:cobalt-precorrin 5A hydrolase [Geobacteraceae bacterium]